MYIASIHTTDWLVCLTLRQLHRALALFTEARAAAEEGAEPLSFQLLQRRSRHRRRGTSACAAMDVAFMSLPSCGTVSFAVISQAHATTGYLHYHSSGESDGADDDDDSALSYYQQSMGWVMPPPVSTSSNQQGSRGYESDDDDDDDEDMYENEYDVAGDYDSDGYGYEGYVTMYDDGEGAMLPVSRSSDGSSNQRRNNSAPRRATTSASAAQLKPPPPPPVLCRFYVLGKCRYGSHCTYSHAIPTPSEDCEMTEEDSLTAAAALVDCPYYLRGNCKYGQYCRLRHTGASAASGNAGVAQTAQSSSAAAATAVAGDRGNNQASGGATETQPEQEFTCGICFDDVVDSGKHFGLLSTSVCLFVIVIAVLVGTPSLQLITLCVCLGCDHCYCLDCLRSWRQSKDMEAEVTRSCPACRLPSNYIVPSLTFCTGEKKRQVVEAYKSHLSVRECKYFNGLFGSCPFGQHCFYAHRNSEGHDIKHLDRPRRNTKHGRGGGTGGGGRGLPSNESLSSLLSNYGSLFRFLESLDWDEYGDAFEMDSEWD